MHRCPCRAFLVANSIYTAAAHWSLQTRCSCLSAVGWCDTGRDTGMTIRNHWQMLSASARVAAAGQWLHSRGHPSPSSSTYQLTKYVPEVCPTRSCLSTVQAAKQRRVLHCDESEDSTFAYVEVFDERS